MGNDTRHYCYKCKKKRQERFMEIAKDLPKFSRNNNGRDVWQCKNDCKQDEHRRYGRRWRDNRWI